MVKICQDDDDRVKMESEEEDGEGEEGDADGLDDTTILSDDEDPT